MKHECACLRDLRQERDGLAEGLVSSEYYIRCKGEHKGVCDTDGAHMQSSDVRSTRVR